MLKNYFVSTIRNQLRNRSYFFINLTGLTLGLLCSLTIYLWVRKELSMDRFHRDINRMALVRSALRESDQSIVVYEDTQGLAAGAALDQIPEVEKACRLLRREAHVSNGVTSINESGLAVDTGFFHQFTFPIIEGDARHTLEGVNAIAVSRSMASRFFGQESAIGKTLRLDGSQDVVVAAVFEDVPDASSLKFDFVSPMEPYILSRNIKMGWGNYSFATYVTLTASADFQVATEKFRNLVKNNDPHDDGAEWLFIQPLQDVYLNSRFVNGQPAGGRIDYVQLFLVAALFILFIACVNFVNLSTARAGRRSKEVGVRKVNGARVSQLIIQFLGESFTLTFLAMVLAVAVLRAALPTINLLLSTHLEMDFYDPPLQLLLLGTWVFTGLAAGLYPAFVLSAFQPSKTLRSAAQQAGGRQLRKTLVVVQFALSVLMLIFTAVIYNQVHFIRHKDLGFSREHVLYFNPRSAIQHTDMFRQGLLKESSILSVSTSTRNPLSINSATTSVTWPGMSSDAVVQFRSLECDYDFMSTIQLRIIAGRGFSREYPKSDSLQQFIITNEAAQRMNLHEPVGTRITLRREVGEIIGVASDFHSRSIYSGIDPVIFKLNPDAGLFFVKVDGAQVPRAIAQIEAAYKQYENTFPFEYHFLDETFASQYRSEVFTERLVTGFSFVSILVAALGLYGLALFSVERRTKEIGIRKVLGAPVLNLVRLLSQETIILVMVANALALPLGWFVAESWLERFAYHVGIGASLFVYAWLITIAVASMVVGGQTWSASAANPMKALKEE